MNHHHFREITGIFGLIPAKEVGLFTPGGSSGSFCLEISSLGESMAKQKSLAFQ
jgi:hypothetical protein